MSETKEPEPVTPLIRDLPRAVPATVDLDLDHEPRRADDWRRGRQRGTDSVEAWLKRW
jgi:hypothetical protein